MKKPLPIGIENYKEIVNKGYYYVDKTLLIKDLLEKGAAVNLFTRPRRFGKTLTISMLKTYFEEEIDAQGSKVDNSHYFDGTRIQNNEEVCRMHMGQYPIISLSLKSAKQADFHLAYVMIKRQIMAEYDRHQYVLSCEQINEEQKKRYQDILLGKGEESLYLDALKFLSDCLKKYHRKNVIILLDEYDVPLENAYFRGFYDQMIDFVQSLFESALKTNDSLEFAVITGCLRISKESIFTGLNNLRIVSLLNCDYAEYFGFTRLETEEILQYYEISQKRQEAEKWYDGYLFGNTEVYNPWSIVNYVYDKVWGGAPFPKPYWSNTSSNNIIRELIEHADAGVKKEIEALIAGNTICKSIHEEITYEDIDTSQDNLWNFLFFTGYLKMKGQILEGNQIFVKLAIPNEEIRYIYQNVIREWFEKQMKKIDFQDFYNHVLSGDEKEIENFLSEQLARSISYYDNAESFYHGYMIGVLNGMDGYEVYSNREAGNGRPDIQLVPLSPKKPAVIFELKSAKKFTEMEKKCEEALEQIEERKYTKKLEEEGYGTILRYGMCFCKKNCMVRKEK